jgi:peptidoglycan/xylan/chitin deacetylase (PgdA/CDA1 family)
MNAFDSTARRQSGHVPDRNPAAHGAGLSRSLLSLLSPAGPGARLSILMFHKVPLQADPLVPGEMDMAKFEQTLDFLEAHTQVLPLSEATVAMQNGSLPSRAVALTFDDGYREWIDNLSPALRRRNMPATFFVTTGQLGGEPLWHERIVAAVRALPDAGLVLPYGFGNYGDLSTIERRIDLVATLQERLKYQPLHERLDAIAQLEAQACRPLIPAQHFDAAMVRALHSHGFEIGAHTINHPILNECSPQQARDEIGGCKDELEAIIGGRVHSFAYPNGRPGTDFGAQHVSLVKACGYQSAVTTGSGAASSRSDPFQLPRFSPWGPGRLRSTLQMARNMMTKGRVLAAPAVDAPATDVRCLMIASTFPPIHGGSAVVYENLCQHMPAGSIRVLTAHTSYVSGAEIEGWREHDAAASFPIERISLLRPRMQPAPANSLVSAARLLFHDVPLYAKAFLRAAHTIRTHGINVVCVGELVAGSMLGIALKKLFKVKLVVYVHGEEITTASSGRLYGNKRKQYLQAFDKVVAVSAFTCDALTGLMDMRPDTITLIPNGVDTDRFTPGPRDEALIRKHKLAGKKIVLTVGRLVARKGIDMTQAPGPALPGGRRRRDASAARAHHPRPRPAGVRDPGRQGQRRRTAGLPAHLRPVRDGQPHHAGRRHRRVWSRVPRSECLSQAGGRRTRRRRRRSGARRPVGPAGGRLPAGADRRGDRTHPARPGAGPAPGRQRPAARARQQHRRRGAPVPARLRAPAGAAPPLIQPLMQCARLAQARHFRARARGQAMHFGQ